MNQLVEAHVAALEARVRELLATNNRLFDLVAKLEKELGRELP